MRPPKLIGLIIIHENKKHNLLHTMAKMLNRNSKDNYNCIVLYDIYKTICFILNVNSFYLLLKEINKNPPSIERTTTLHRGYK